MRGGTPATSAPETQLNSIVPKSIPTYPGTQFHSIVDEYATQADTTGILHDSDTTPVNYTRNVMS